MKGQGEREKKKRKILQLLPVKVEGLADWDGNVKEIKGIPQLSPIKDGGSTAQNIGEMKGRNNTMWIEGNSPTQILNFNNEGIF